MIHRYKNVLVLFVMARIVKDLNIKQEEILVKLWSLYKMQYYTVIKNAQESI